MKKEKKYLISIKKKKVMMKFYVCKSYQNSKHFQVWTNFDIEVFQTIRCKQGRKNEPLSSGLYVHECTRLDVKIIRDNTTFIEVKDLRELKN